ncbi:MAG: adenylate/guanylate cyclase domain-containing protein [Actinomycetota bacterium]
MNSVGLLPYVPRMLATWPQDLDSPSFQQIEGSMIFADISGFTALSEKLAKQGRMGAEELVSVINSTFDRLLAVAYEENGSLLKFGGDALLLFFADYHHQVRAARSAARMRQELRSIGKIQTSKGSVSLKISIGIHSDLFQFYLVGDSHHDLVITGPAATSTVSMEATATGGEILLSPQTAVALPIKHLGNEKGAGVLLQGVPDVDSSAPPQFIPTSSDIAIHIPLAIREHLVQGGEGAAHRLVTVMFIHFDGVDALFRASGVETVRDAVHELVTEVQRAANKHGVTYIDSDIDTDGGKIYLAGGAPITKDDDEGRMLLAAREIIEARTEIPVRIGINRGHVFTGDIGPSYRRTYTYMGDAVNLAARVMARASKGQLLATEGVIERTPLRFETQGLEPFTVKGKVEAVRAFEVGRYLGRKEQSGTKTRMVGRERELETLWTAVRDSDSAGRLVEINGEAGFGKSRLLDELRTTVAAGTRIISSRCEQYETNTPFSSIKSVLRDGLGIDLQDADPVAERKLRQQVQDHAPSLTPWVPLIGIPLGLEITPSHESELLEDRFRKSKMLSATSELLRAILPGPTIFIFEDAHWMDEASSDLLGQLVADVGTTRWTIATARRPIGPGFNAAKSENAVTIDVGPVSEESVRELINEVTRNSPLLPHQIDAIVQRAGGHPMFVEQLIGWVASGQTDVLPDNLEQAISIKIDQLPPKDRTILRKLSVLGNSFAKSLASEILELDIQSENPFLQLDAFIEDDGQDLRFRNALLRDAGYWALPYKTRQELHAAVGEKLESSGDIEEQAATLSLHFYEARRFDKVWKYGLDGAKHSQKVFAQAEAVRLYERAVDAAKKTPVNNESLVEALALLSDVAYYIGEFQKAETALRKAHKIAGDSPVVRAGLIRRQVRIPYRSGRLPNAIRWITKGISMLEGIDDESASVERGALLAWYAAVRQDQGRSKEAMRLCLEAIEESKKVNDLATLARASTLLDLAYMSLGIETDHKDSKVALSIYEQRQDHEGRARVLNNLGGFAFLRGHWDEAIGYYRSAREDKVATGDVAGASLVGCNIAEILSDQGYLEEAEKFALDALLVWRASGQWFAGFALCMLGRIAYRSGRVQEAGPLLEEANAHFRRAGASAQVSITDSYLAEAAQIGGDYEMALEICDRLIDASTQDQGARMQLGILHRLRGASLVAMGEIVEGEKALHQSLEVVRRMGQDFETSQTLLALADLGGASAQEWLIEADQIIKRLGVRSRNEKPAPA